MIATLKNYVKQHLFPSAIKEKDSVEAYDIWSKNYDEQPDNLMLDLDEAVFTKLLASLPIQNKKVADIGCGTGRHWQKILNLRPAKLTGFDVSCTGGINCIGYKRFSHHCRLCQQQRDRF